MRQFGQLLLISLIALAPVFAPSLMATGTAIAVPSPSAMPPIWYAILALAAVVIAVLAFRLVALRRECARLNAANTALTGSLSSRTEFLATTSHEIRTPLNGILGMTQVMLADGQLDAGVRDRISVVHGAGETMKALIDDILDIAKIDAGGLTIESVTVDFRQLIQDTETLWRTQVAAKGLRLDIDLAGCPAMIVGDPLRLRQILSNLMSNAIKFTDQGSVTLSARSETGPDGERLVVRVRDTGIGVPPRQQDLIFEKYRQADGSIKRRFGGTGLGLAICRSLARAMGGAILIDSVPGEGSTFTVTLPLVRPGADTMAAEPADRRDVVTRLADARLLIVEQNPLTRRVMVGMLENMVARIETATSLPDAEERLARGGIDHVVADIACTGIDDRQAHSGLMRLCDLGRTSGARMTLLFAPSRAETAESITRSADVQALAKPIAAPDLVTALADLYERGAPPRSAAVPPSPVSRAAHPTFARSTAE